MIKKAKPKVKKIQSVVVADMEDQLRNQFEVAETELEREYANSASLVNKKGVAKPGFKKSLQQIDTLQKRMFSTFDAWQRFQKTKIEISENKLTMLVGETISAHGEAMTLSHLPGLERHRIAKKAAESAYEALKTSGARVREHSYDLPLCEEHT